MPYTNGTPKAWAPPLCPPKRRRSATAKKKPSPAVGKPAVVNPTLPEISWQGYDGKVFASFNPNWLNEPQSVWRVGERAGRDIYATWVIRDQPVIQKKVKKIRLGKGIVFVSPTPILKNVISYRVENGRYTRTQTLQAKDVAKARLLGGTDGDKRIYASLLTSQEGHGLLVFDNYVEKAHKRADRNHHGP